VAPSLGDKAALWFVGLAMAFIVLALTGHDLDGWAFNITTEALGIAATVLVETAIASRTLASSSAPTSVSE